MRKHVIEKLLEIARIDENVFLLNGDLGFGVLDSFKKEFPERCINTGIAEQNMASIATGLALEGNTVFTYSIGNFPTLRCVEQIRNDICYHNANVKIIAVGGGFSYGSLGMTHHATEDIAMMRSLPGMRVYVPSDSIEAAECLSDAYDHFGPAYIRIEKENEPVINNNETNILSIHKIVNYGNDVAIIAIGTVIVEAIEAAKKLKEVSIGATVYSCPIVKPLSSDSIIKIAHEAKVIATIEEHNIIGGIGSAVSEIVSSINNIHSVVLRLGLDDTFASEVGDQNYLRNYYGISSKQLVTSITKELEGIL